MLLTDLPSLKSMLDIDQENTSEDVKLWFLIEQASAWIEDILDRPGLSYGSRTEFYGGSGTQKLLLRSRPVFVSPTIQVWEDGNGYYGSTSGAFASNTELTFGQDFCLETGDGVMGKSGILVRFKQVWKKPQIRQAGYLTPFIGPSFGSIKVTYTAGYTVDTLPPPFRLAMTFLVAKMRQVLPLGFPLSAESYEERSLSYFYPYKNIWLSHVWSMLAPYKNWSW